MEKKKKIILGIVFLLILTLVLLTFIVINKNNNNSQSVDKNKENFLNQVSFEERGNIIKNILSQKFSVSSEESSVLIARELPGYVSGVFLNPNLKEGRGQIYFYAVVDKNVDIIWSGTSDPDCSILQKYNFPQEMAVNCY